jgi:lysophospholipid acyltransferase (LPLAT)-like uncharacterized protein
VSGLLLPLGLRTAGAALAQSWHLHVVGEEHVRELRERGTPVLFAVWHQQLLPPLWHRRGERIALLVSGHRDGQRLADAARRWGYDVVFGSSTRGGMNGLRRIVRRLREGTDVGFAPDGPRGPARVAKDGVIVAARHGGAAIVPVATASTAAWRLRSWDAFQIPCPGATVRLVYGMPLEVTGRPDVERPRLERALARAAEVARCSG